MSLPRCGVGVRTAPFADRYTHRRTSVTLVFGYRGDTCEDVDVARAPDVRVVQSPDL